jgi:hypothetical protein
MIPTSVSLADSAAKGYLSIYKQYVEDGRVESILENDPNIITYKSRRIHLESLYKTDAAIDLLDTFKVGTGGAVGSDTSGNTNIRIISPNPTRNDLYAPVSLVNKSIQVSPSNAVTYPDQVFLQILFTLSQDEANGLFINECGIFKESGDMFNHKTFTSIPKNESFSLIFDWKIRYI